MLNMIELAADIGHLCVLTVSSASELGAAAVNLRTSLNLNYSEPQIPLEFETRTILQ